MDGGLGLPHQLVVTGQLGGGLLGAAAHPVVKSPILRAHQLGRVGVPAGRGAGDLLEAGRLDRAETAGTRERGGDLEPEDARALRVQVHPEIRQRPRRPGVRLAAGGEEVDEPCPAGGRQLAHHRRVGRDVRVARRAGRGGTFLHGGRREEHQPCARMAPPHLAQQDLVLAPEIREPVRAGEGLVEPVTQHDHVGRPRRQQPLQVLGVALRPPAVAHLVPGPRQAADAQPELGVRQLEPGLEEALLEEPFHHPRAVEKVRGSRAWRGLRRRQRCGRVERGARGERSEQEGETKAEADVHRGKRARGVIGRVSPPGPARGDGRTRRRTGRCPTASSSSRVCPRGGPRSGPRRPRATRRPGTTRTAPAA